MKKLFSFFVSITALLACVFTSSFAYGQIAPIQVEEKPYEFFTTHIMKENATGNYIWQITSTNQFETTAVHLKLGTTPEEVMQSLAALFAVYANVNTQFNLQGYNFYVSKYELTATHTGLLEYTAGDYNIHYRDLRADAEKFLHKMKLPLGEIHITKASKFSSGAFNVHYDTYGFSNLLQFGNCILNLSQEYTEGDQISIEDIRVLQKVAENPQSYRGKEKRAPYVHDKDAFLSVCAHIFNEQQ